MGNGVGYVIEATGSSSSFSVQTNTLFKGYKQCRCDKRQVQFEA